MVKNRHTFLGIGTIPSGALWVPIGIFLAALTVRLVYLAQDSTSPFFFSRFVDARQYHEFALGFARGSWPASEAFFRPPLYPMFLGVLYKIFGPDVAAIKLVQALVGSFTCLIVYFISLRVFSQRSVAVIAGIICSVCGTMIYFDGQLLSANLDVFLQVLSIWILLVAFGKERKKAFWFFVAGAIVGLSIVNRGSMLFFIPPVLIWMCFQHRAQAAVTDNDSPRSTGTVWFLGAATFLLAVAVVISPVAWHNAAYDHHPESRYTDNQENLDADDISTGDILTRIWRGEFNLLGSGGGINLYMGNHAKLQEINTVDSHDHFRRFNRIMGAPYRGGISTASKHNSYFKKKTRDYIREHPRDWIKLMGRKMFLLFNGAEVPRVSMIYADRQYSTVLSASLWKKVVAFPSGLLIPLALCGILLSRSGFSRHGLLVLVLATQCVFVVTFFVTARYRLPSLPFYSVYAAYALHFMYTNARAVKNRRKVIGFIVLLGALTVAANCGIGEMTSEHGSFEHFNLANELQRNGKQEEAIVHFEKALKQDPKNVSARNNLGYALERIGKIDEAIHHYREGLRYYPGHANTHANLANALMRKGQIEDAIQHYRKALEIDPNHVNAGRNLAAALLRVP